MAAETPCNLISATIAAAASPPAAATTYDVILRGAKDVSITLYNTGANPITALALTRIPRVDGDVGAAVAGSAQV